MSYTSYSDARISRAFRPVPRLVLKSPEREVAFRTEHVVRAKTTLILKPARDDSLEVGYRIVHEDNNPAFTVTGRKFGDRSCREFRDASGLPLFDIHRWSALSVPFHWYFTMPGSDRKSKIATADTQTSLKGGDLKFTFQNLAASDLKMESEKDVTLMVRRHGEALRLFDIIDGDRRIGEVRESIRHNEKLYLTKRSRRQGFRPALEIIIVPGVDATLV
ncbi:hypothetical protein N7533_004951 [Penicillium manginii]|uniref:uncharacterized protein n=1 Tax=Penicillium manginii TaxID=203109 RepID=UPI002546A588|nr:uncharacterized protein N7533_004951 [Penicillium manginii]KAJ5755408.1 hypothetical protein N7533_004951 [Penicillium manginii]